MDFSTIINNATSTSNQFNENTSWFDITNILNNNKNNEKSGKYFENMNPDQVMTFVNQLNTNFTVESLQKPIADDFFDKIFKEVVFPIPNKIRALA